jgi:hypothetical protein
MRAASGDAGYQHQAICLPERCIEALKFIDILLVEKQVYERAQLASSSVEMRLERRIKLNELVHRFGNCGSLKLELAISVRIGT